MIERGQHMPSFIWLLLPSIIYNIKFSELLISTTFSFSAICMVVTCKTSNLHHNKRSSTIKKRPFWEGRVLFSSILWILTQNKRDMRPVEPQLMLIRAVIDPDVTGSMCHGTGANSFSSPSPLYTLPWCQWKCLLFYWRVVRPPSPPLEPTHTSPSIWKQQDSYLHLTAEERQWRMWSCFGTEEQKLLISASGKC